MAIYVYPPVSLSITSGPTAFMRDGATVTVSKDTITPANSRGLPVELLDTAGVPFDISTLAKEAKQDDAITILSNIEGTDFALDSTLVDLITKADEILAQVSSTEVKVSTAAKQDIQTTALGDINAELDTQTARLALLSTEAKQDTQIARLALLSTEAKQDTQITRLNLLATEAKQDAEAVLVGALNEAAPASDTANSGLNGRLQRIAQRITSLIALLPTSLGQKTMANSLAVVLPSDQTVKTSKETILGAVTTTFKPVGLAAVRATVDGLAPVATRKKLIIKSKAENSGRIWLGGATVTIADGLEIIGPDRLEFEFDGSDYFLISDTAAQVVEILEVI
jgi:hypothetical protein